MNEEEDEEGEVEYYEGGEDKGGDCSNGAKHPTTGAKRQNIPSGNVQVCCWSHNFEPCYFIVHILYLIVIVLKFVSITICYCYFITSIKSLVLISFACKYCKWIFSVNIRVIEQNYYHCNRELLGVY